MLGTQACFAGQRPRSERWGLRAQHWRKVAAPGESAAARRAGEPCKADDCCCCGTNLQNERGKLPSVLVLAFCQPVSLAGARPRNKGPSAGRSLLRKDPALKDGDREPSTGGSKKRAAVRPGAGALGGVLGQSPLLTSPARPVAGPERTETCPLRGEQAQRAQAWRKAGLTRVFEGGWQLEAFLFSKQKFAFHRATLVSERSAEHPVSLGGRPGPGTRAGCPSARKLAACAHLPSPLASRASCTGWRW